MSWRPKRHRVAHRLGVRSLDITHWRGGAESAPRDGPFTPPNGVEGYAIKHGITRVVRQQQKPSGRSAGRAVNVSLKNAASLRRTRASRHRRWHRHSRASVAVKSAADRRNVIMTRGSLASCQHGARIWPATTTHRTICVTRRLLPANMGASRQRSCFPVRELELPREVTCRRRRSGNAEICRWRTNRAVISVPPARRQRGSLLVRQRLSSAAASPGCAIPRQRRPPG